MACKLTVMGKKGNYFHTSTIFTYIALKRFPKNITLDKFLLVVAFHISGIDVLRQLTPAQNITQVKVLINKIVNILSSGNNPLYSTNKSKHE